MKIGIIGAGSIAAIIPNTCCKLKEAEAYAVASRSLEKAEAFAKKYGIPKAYGCYEDLLKDKDVDLVYIATPHSHHFEHMKMCLKYGKNILCEKAFTMNAKQTEEIIELAKGKNLYIAEAIWTRYMPSRKIINDVIASGIIGNVHVLTANLAYEMKKKTRLITPELAGGALLDVGVYPINFALMHFGKDIERVESSVQMTSEGVDGYESITIFYRDGKIAQLTSSLYARSDRKGIIWGDKGYIVVENINNPNAINVFDSSDKLIKSCEIPSQISGYEYEILEAENQIKAGMTESVSMPLEESLYVMKFMDNLRKDWKLVYPQEKC